MSVDWKAFEKDIAPHDSFVLVSHVRPDCDAVGSELGMKLVLEAIGKTVRIINAHATPPAIEFIDPDNVIEVLGEGVDAADVDPDCVMILDTSAWPQLGSMGDVIRELKCPRIVVDHHVGQDDLGATFHKDTSAEATGHLVVQAADALGVKLTKAMAIPLYAAIATDTGWFRFGSVTPDTYRIIARLVEAGAMPAEIYGNLYECDTLGRVKLRGLVLSRTTSELDGRLMHTHVLATDFDEIGALPGDTEDVINLTLSIAGTEAAVIFVGIKSGGYKLSFRSRGKMDCNAVAKQFGGGGHKAAAGATFEGTLDEARAAVLPVVKAAVG